METEEMRIVRLKKEQSVATKNKNIQKHLRIAEATTGHQKEVHLQKAERLVEKYSVTN